MPGSFFTPTTLGIALVDGYDAMGLEYISHPQLRAEVCIYVSRSHPVDGSSNDLHL